MKICPSCNTHCEDEALFCTSCGAKLEEAGAPNPAPVNKIDPKKIGIVVLIAAVLVAAFCLLFGGNKSEKTAEKYVEAMMEADAGKLMDLMPDDYLDYVMESMEAEWEDLEEDLQSYLDYMMESYNEEYGEDFKYSYEIVDSEEQEQDEIDEMNEELADMELDIEIKKAIDYEIELTLEGEDGEDELTENVTVVKIGSKWYILGF